MHGFMHLLHEVPAYVMARGLYAGIEVFFDSIIGFTRIRSCVCHTPSVFVMNVS